MSFLRALVLIASLIPSSQAACEMSTVAGSQSALFFLVTKSARAFGSVEMQNRNVNKDVIDYLMGHKVTYIDWKNRYNQLLEIYRQARPRLNEEQAMNDTLEYGKAIGCSFDPKPDVGISELVKALAETVVNELKRQRLLGRQ